MENAASWFTAKQRGEKEMSEKVYGLKEKHLWILQGNLNRSKLMPVRLKSESVSIKEHKEKVEKSFRQGYDNGFEAGQVSKEIKKQTKEYVEGIQQNVHGYIPKDKAVSTVWLEKWCKEEIEILDGEVEEYDRGIKDILYELLDCVREQANKKQEK